MKRPTFKRPYATHYYSSTGDREPSFSSQGAAGSDYGAIRATVVRIFMGQYAKALIHDRRDGTLLYTIKYDSTGLKIHYGAEPASTTLMLRRVK